MTYKFTLTDIFAVDVGVETHAVICSELVYLGFQPRLLPHIPTLRYVHVVAFRGSVRVVEVDCCLVKVLNYISGILQKIKL